ncbi:MAG: YbaB/EbfC family nucleoid-associated protein [Candidatus Eisenbacteria bacterium]|uniref:Nucleoid-associated protein E6K72_01380 n=1 Tax=Eiseniibacteriota bacterium TaxID=2212470 RepID=A0A538T803_UNCEI|nr:MAG: YbaB/EbfC family nucleoid-associated protein [Candidatus Eisenbacteria bacterium]
MKGFGDMLKQAQRMKRDFDELQERLAGERFEASAGGGTVRAVVDGKQLLKELKLDPALLAEPDVTLIEDLVLTAVGEAQRASEAKMHEALKKLTRAPDRGAGPAPEHRAQERPAAGAPPAARLARGRAAARGGHSRGEGARAFLQRVRQLRRRGSLRAVSRSRPRRLGGVRGRAAGRRAGLRAHRPVPRALPRAGRRALAARRHPSRAAPHPGAARAHAPGSCDGRRRRSCGRSRDPGDHPRHQPQRGGRGDRALPVEAADPARGARDAHRARRSDGLRPRVLRPRHPGPRPRGPARGRVGRTQALNAMFQPLLSPLWLLSVPVFVALNAFFVAAEFALVSVRWTRVEQLVGERKWGALSLRYAAEHLDDSLAAAQLGITFTSLALGWVGEPVIAHLFEPVFGAIPGPWGVAVTHTVAIAIAFLLITYMHVVLGEQVPKVIAIERAEDVGLFVAGPVVAFSRLARPFISVIRYSSTGVMRSLRLPPLPPAKLVHSVDELRMLVEETREAGVIPEDQASYMRNVLLISDKKVREVMVPREKVVTVSLSANEEEVLGTARVTAHTRMPVWDGNPDNIVGIVNTKDLFHLFSLKGLVILEDAMYPPIFAQPEQRVGWLLQTFKREKRQMAVVRDVWGRFLGIVTVEDILGEIVGEIEDEHDWRPAGAGRAFGAGGEPQAATAGPGAAGAPGTTVGGPPPTSDEVVPHGTLDRRGIVG